VFGIVFCSFLLALVGVVTITTSRISAFAKHPVVRSFSYFGCLVPRYRLSGVPLPGLMMTSNITTPVLTLTCFMLQGFLLRYGGLVAEDGSVIYSSLNKEDIREERARSCLLCSSHLPCGRGGRDNLWYCSRGYASAGAFHSFSSSYLGPYPGG
jgi:hypothetical protein